MSILALLKTLIIRSLGGYMFEKIWKTIVGWMIPSSLDYLVKEGVEFLDDPETHDDDDIVKNMVDANRKYAEYKLNKIIG